MRRWWLAVMSKPLSDGTFPTYGATTEYDERVEQMDGIEQVRVVEVPEGTVLVPLTRSELADLRDGYLASNAYLRGKFDAALKAALKESGE